MKHIILSFLFILSTIVLQAQIEAQLKKEIDKILYYDIHVDYEKVPGFVIGIILQDSMYVLSYGHVSKSENKKPDGHTIFEIGDISKVFTASLIAQMEAEGLLKYDAPFDQYIGETEKNLYSHNMTVADLLSHTSGLPKMPFGFGLKEKESNNPYAHYTKKDLIRFYREYIFDDKPKRKYLFSNVNYALLEILIENIYKQPYEQVVKEQLLDPLQMYDTRIQLSKEQNNRLAKGYNLGGQKMPTWSYQSFAASVGLKSTVNDMLQFAAAQFDGQHKSFDKLHQLAFPTEIDKRTWIGKGWHILKIKKYYDLVAHTGTTSGHRAFLGFIKETKTAVVILSNSKMGMNSLAYSVLKMINNHWKKRKTKKFK